MEKNYEELEETLRKIYHGDNEAFNTETMNELSLVLWKAKQYDKIKEIVEPDGMPKNRQLPR